MTELMSLEEIETLASEPSDEWTIAATKHLLETARVAHELQAEITRLEETIADLNNEKSIIKRNYVLLARARAEERERCAKLAESYLNYGLKLEGLAKDIRELKD